MDNILQRRSQNSFKSNLTNTFWSEMQFCHPQVTGLHFFANRWTLHTN